MLHFYQCFTTHLIGIHKLRIPGKPFCSYLTHEVNDPVVATELLQEIWYLYNQRKF